MAADTQVFIGPPVLTNEVRLRLALNNIICNLKWRVDRIREHNVLLFVHPASLKVSEELEKAHNSLWKTEHPSLVELEKAVHDLEAVAATQTETLAVEKWDRIVVVRVKQSFSFSIVYEYEYIDSSDWKTDSQIKERQANLPTLHLTREVPGLTQDDVLILRWQRFPGNWYEPLAVVPAGKESPRVVIWNFKR